MPTGDSRVNLLLKRMLSHTRLSGNLFEFLRDECRNAAKRTFNDQSGLFTNPVTLSVNYTLNTFDISPTVTEGMTSEGNVLTTSATHATGIHFENTLNYIYFIGLSFCEVPDGIYTNQRTNVPEYDMWKSEIGLRSTPDSVTDNGDGTITFNVSSLVDPQSAFMDQTGRTVKVWLKNPVSLTESIAIEDCTVAFSTPINSITTTANSLGQSTISVNPLDYEVALIGPQVSNLGASSTNPFADEVIYVAQITGGTPGSVAYTDQVYLYDTPDYTDHAIQNIQLNSPIMGSFAYGANPAPINIGIYDDSLNVNTILISDFNDPGFGSIEMISYNGYDYYDPGALIPWNTLYFPYDMDTDNNGNRVVATTNGLYYSTNMGAWTLWPGSNATAWSAVHHDRSGLWCMVDITNGRIYSSPSVGGALTQRSTSASTHNSRHILLHTHHPAGLLSPTDPGNPYWIYMTYTGSSGTILGSADGLTWAAITPSAVSPGTIDVTSGNLAWDRVSNNLAYSPTSQRWVHINSSGSATGAHPTIIYSEDNGQSWTEVNDAFGFAAGGTGKYPATGNGQRCITHDGKGNFVVSIIKKEARVNKAPTDTFVMYFASADEGLTWFRVYGKQLEDASVDHVTAASWLNATREIQFIQSGKEGTPSDFFYFSSTIKVKD
jgi:hypothetical protein